jgi:transposase, IS5 family
MKQVTLAAVGFERYGKTTHRAAFLAEMDQVVPWSALWALAEPVYPNPGNGRPPVGVGRMLRIYFFSAAVVQPVGPGGGGSALRFVGDARICRHRPGPRAVPDETTVCRFRHLIERHDLGSRLFEEVHRHLEAKELKFSKGTIVDATIIAAPSATKNAEKARDPHMHQTKKGNQWYFGMKAHVGIDSRS